MRVFKNRARPKKQVSWYSITQLTSDADAHNLIFWNIIMPPVTKSRRYCFTLNNWTPANEAHLNSLGTDPHIRYLVFGRETAASGTPHLQGFVIFDNSITFANAKTKLGSDSFHLEVARGTSQQAATYCKKDGDFSEFGHVPADAGKRTDIGAFADWIRDLGRLPSKRELLTNHPHLHARYKKWCYEYAEALLEPVNLTGDEAPREGWQADLATDLEATPDKREIIFVVDPEGNSGKSWFCRWALSKEPDTVQLLRIGKRDDLAHAIDPKCTKFMIDVPRGQMEYLQYAILESLKDQYVFSPKYDSSLKTLRHVPHVVVFSNEYPDMTALTDDRYNVISTY